jgi:hypothetical protein
VPASSNSAIPTYALHVTQTRATQEHAGALIPGHSATAFKSPSSAGMSEWIEAARLSLSTTCRGLPRTSTKQSCDGFAAVGISQPHFDNQTYDSGGMSF